MDGGSGGCSRVPGSLQEVQQRNQSQHRNKRSHHLRHVDLVLLKFFEQQRGVSCLIREPSPSRCNSRVASTVRLQPKKRYILPSTGSKAASKPHIKAKMPLTMMVSTTGRKEMSESRSSYGREKQHLGTHNGEQQGRTKPTQTPRNIPPGHWSGGRGPTRKSPVTCLRAAHRLTRSAYRPRP